MAGYVIAPQERLFLLTEPATRSSSPWISLGQSWRGYALAAFDPNTGILTVARNGSARELRLRNSPVGTRISGLVRGDFTLVDGTRVYSPDAQLVLGPDLLVSSPNGIMVSDQRQQIVAGDLTLQMGNSTTRVVGGVLYWSEGHLVMNGETIRMSVAAPAKTP